MKYSMGEWPDKNSNKGLNGAAGRSHGQVKQMAHALSKEMGVRFLFIFLPIDLMLCNLGS